MYVCMTRTYSIFIVILSGEIYIFFYNKHTQPQWPSINEEGFYKCQTTILFALTMHYNHLSSNVFPIKLCSVAARYKNSQLTLKKLRILCVFLVMIFTLLKTEKAGKTNFSNPPDEWRYSEIIQDWFFVQFHLNPWWSASSVLLVFHSDIWGFY